MNGLRDLPSVHAVLAWPRVAALAARHGHGKVARAAREAVETARRARRGGSTGEDAVVDEARVEARLLVPASTLQPVLNGTGILVHTNLGRAPLAAEAIAAMVEISSGYSTVEYDLDNGKRGDRHGHAAPLLTALTGAEDALVVNNAAAALLLALAAVARGRQVIVSRGELVEVGGGFRIPDVLAESGAELVEVGTTNRTHLADYERAIGERSALLLKVHRSSFGMVGFTREVPLAELAELGRSRGLPVLHDAGSGCLGGFDRDTDETVASSVRAGADLVVFSGDKLLGGPQAGLLVGRRALVARAREHPLLRAVPSR